MTRAQLDRHSRPSAPETAALSAVAGSSRHFCRHSFARCRCVCRLALPTRNMNSLVRSMPASAQCIAAAPALALHLDHSASVPPRARTRRWRQGWVRRVPHSALNFCRVAVASSMNKMWCGSTCGGTPVLESTRPQATGSTRKVVHLRRGSQLDGTRSRTKLAAGRRARQRGGSGSAPPKQAHHAGQ
jgi:hypothetical protein